jgi:hypothetical protein
MKIFKSSELWDLIANLSVVIVVVAAVAIS